MNTSLTAQLEQAVLSCDGIFAEYRLPCTDYLIVEIAAHADGIMVTADFTEQRYFSGNVTEFPLGFLISFDAENEPELDYYLQEINDEITEGYLLPNGLAHNDDDGEY